MDTENSYNDVNIVFADDVPLQEMQGAGGTMLALSEQSLDHILVDLHDQLVAYSEKKVSDKDAATKDRLVSQIASLVSTPMPNQEKELAADVMLSLIKQAEIDIRESLSDRLAFFDDVPQRVIHEFVHDAITVAQPVLMHSPCLNEMDLMYIIRSKGAEYWQAIAKRRDLKAGLIDHLADTKDEQTAATLLKNTAIELHHRAMKVFAGMSRYSKMIADPLVNRPELPADLAVDLYWHVSTQLREKILQEHDIPKATLDAALQDILQDFSDTNAGLNDHQPTIMMIDLARRYKRLNRISDAMLIKTLQRGQAKFFIALYAERCRLEHRDVHNMMAQVGGQGLAITAKACDVNKENFVSLFLLSRSTTRGDRAVDAQELRQAIKNYDKTSKAKAASVMVEAVKNGKIALLGMT